MTVQCRLCGAEVPFDDGPPGVKQTASFGIDNGCSQMPCRWTIEDEGCVTD